MAFNYNRDLFNDYEKMCNTNDKLVKDNKLLKIKLEVAENDAQLYKQKAEEAELKAAKVDELIEALKTEKDLIISSLENKVLELQRQLDKANYEKDYYKSKTITDGTNAGIPTSQTPLNKKKVIPNSREKSDKSIGGQPGHEKNKLERFADEEVNEHVDELLDKCPHCGSTDLEMLEDETTKDELDYYIKIIKRRHHYKKQLCRKCGKIVRKQIPTKLKEENQYGDKVQATALTLANIGNVPINKVSRIISGLSLNEINLSEGFISKLQKRASVSLETFIKDLKFYMVHLDLLYWDDTVIMISTKRACLRFYGNEDVALYCAHEHKNAEGIDADGILDKLTSKTTVEHDHNIINYNDKYSFTNAECCTHLLRDLQKVSDNIPNRTWSNNLKKVFQENIHKRNTLLAEGYDSFSDDDFNDFLSQINKCLLLGFDEYSKDDKVYYADKEEDLLIRLMEYRDNYIYWTLDFGIPTTNNLSERRLRDTKSKMKISGQFQNVEHARYYANIKSYITTCNVNGVNEHVALQKLMDGNPYTLKEILEIGKKRNEK